MEKAFFFSFLIFMLIFDFPVIWGLLNVSIYLLIIQRECFSDTLGSRWMDHFPSFFCMVFLLEYQPFSPLIISLLHLFGCYFLFVALWSHWENCNVCIFFSSLPHLKLWHNNSCYFWGYICIFKFLHYLIILSKWSLLTMADHTSCS